MRSCFRFEMKCWSQNSTFRWRRIPTMVLIHPHLCVLQYFKMKFSVLSEHKGFQGSRGLWVEQTLKSVNVFLCFPTGFSCTSLESPILRQLPLNMCIIFKCPLETVVRLKKKKKKYPRCTFEGIIFAIFSHPT